MWVITEPGNEAALATYRSINGFDEAESVTFTLAFDDADLANATAR
jgi:hypothetical protein